MPDFVQLWVYLSSAPLVGLTSTLVVYLLALAFYQRVGQAPWANPVLWSILALGAVLLVLGGSACLWAWVRLAPTAVLERKP